MDPSQPPITPVSLGRSRGRGRALYQHPSNDPQQRPQTPWSLTEGGPRPPVPIVSRTALGIKTTTTTTSDETSMGGRGGRGAAIKLPTQSELSTTAHLGRGQPVALPQATGSDPSKKMVYPDARPSASDLDKKRRDAREAYVRTRPKQIVSKTGTEGQKITCEANYFRLKKAPSWNIYLHRIDFQPEILLDKTRRDLIRSVNDIFGGGYLFDGTQLFLTTKLEDPAGPIERTVTSDDGNAVKIIIKFVGVVQMQEERAIQILNLIVRRAMDGLRLQTIGRNKFDAAAKELVRSLKLEVWPGYITSIRQHENDILLCAELTSKVMRADTVHDILEKLLTESRGDFRPAAVKALLGTTVLTDYNNRTYRIDDILFDKSPRDTFETADGTQMSYIDYYKKYNKTIKDMNQPLLVSSLKDKDARGGQKKDVLLIPELCRATGLTDDMRSNFRTMKELGQYTKIGPGMRMERLLAFNRRLNNSEESRKTLDRWNLELEPELIKIPARVMPFPKLVFGGNKTVELINKTDWTYEFRNRSMFHTIDMNRWILIYPLRAKAEAQQFVQALQQAGRGMNFNIAPPKTHEIQNDNQITIGNELNTAGSLNPQLIMCIVSNNNADRYATIKKRCYIEIGVPSQVIVHKTITPKDKSRAVSGLLSVATKVAIQVNTKLGGIPWMLEVPVSGLMTVGFDVCHDPKDKRASWGAMVATMDLKKGNNEFFSTVNRHGKNEEIGQQLAANMSKALLKFHEINGCLPSRVLFFRDGVGDGQIAYVYNTELKAMQDTMKNVYMNMGIQDEIKFTYIIVTKRINTRIFFNKRNPDPGTCVDDIITLPERYDFFIVPQSVREGTVSPTGFNVIYDSMGLPPDRLQQLTFRFTFFYFNWTGTVKVPALCQYAHKLAFLASQSMQGNPNPKLDNTLYYL